MKPHHTPRKQQFLNRITCAALLLFALPLFFTAGCSKPPSGVHRNNDNKPTGDPWAIAAAGLRTETDVRATKSVLTTLTSDVSQRGQEQLPVMSDQAIAALSEIIPLSQEDREEIRGSAFSAHDPVYLADCFYLRDAARALSVSGLAPEVQADLAFAWVCRQVYLQPWLMEIAPDRYSPTALPPTAVLKRGFGSGLERMYVFLALLQQLEMQGCLIGGPQAAGEWSRMGRPVISPYFPERIPGGPFWAVGVRIGEDVRLYDPWRGQPFPVSLKQLKANPEAAKEWFENIANYGGTTIEDARTATVYLAVPVNSLTPRMALFEAKLKSDLKVKVAFDRQALEAMRSAFPDPKPVFWNPPEDQFAYGRAARYFLPLEEGGADRTKESPGRLYESYMREQISKTAFAMPPGLESPLAADRIRMAAAGSLIEAFVKSPNPRERIQRGQFTEAATTIVSVQEQFAAGLERLRTQDSAQQALLIKEWAQHTNSLYDDLIRAQRAKNSAEEERILSAIQENWKNSAARMLVDKASAEVGRAEAAFLLALCKHELAERAQVHLQKAADQEKERLRIEAIDSWKTAAAAWRTYEQFSTSHSGFPGRAAHGKSLSTRATEMLKQLEKKT